MRRNPHAVLLLIGVLPLLWCAAPVGAVTLGDPFPSFVQVNTLDAAECDYLGVDCTADFDLSRLTQPVILIEFLNVYCHTCRGQVPIFNRIYDTIARDPHLAGNVAMIGVAVGNSDREVAEFKQLFRARYPIITDPDKRIFHSTGNIQGTPHTYILRKDEHRFIVDYHAGGVTSPDRYLQTMRYALRGTYRGVAPGNQVPDFACTVDGGQISNTSLAGSRYLLYFPAARQYPLAIDTRNTANQAAVLQSIQQRYPHLVLVVVGYAGMDRSAVAWPAGVQFIAAAQADALQQFRAADGPLVYMVNEYGRISYRGEAITLWNAARIIDGRQQYREPEINPEELVELVEGRLEEAGLRVVETEKYLLDARTVLYVTALGPKRDGRFIFSRLVTAPSLCDICHDTQFVYCLDQQGTIRDFIPVQLTKLGNVAWDSDDTEKMRDYFVGRSIFDTFAFDPKVDAVATATMSSSLVFEKFNQAKTLFADFTEYRFRADHWRSVCHATMAAIKAEIARRTAAPMNDALVQEICTSRGWQCPLHGMYIVLDNDLLCSIHGRAAMPQPAKSASTPGG